MAETVYSQRRLIILSGLSKSLEFKKGSSFVTRPVHLVGSIPLENSDTVMRTCCAKLGDKLARVPDGETGIRTNWIQWQRDIFGSHRAIELVGEGKNAETVMPRFALRQDFEDELQFNALGYQAAALESYRVFRQLREQGQIGPQRFQVCLPTPLAAVACYVDPNSQERIFPAYESALKAEAQAIIAAIDPQDLALQWDVAIEFAVLEGLFPVWFDAPFETIATKLAHLADTVPEPVEMGFHFCYGDSGNQHFKEPETMDLLVRLANRVTGLCGRPVHWIHMPVPIDRDDAAYFQPLQELDRRNLVQLFLGLLHEQDGVEGAKRRMAAADRFITDYGVATECGLGRRKPGIIDQLLDLHAAI